MSNQNSENQLPPVAKSIFVECKKCGAERYHTVLAHTSSTSAKLKCEVCGSSRNHKLVVEKMGNEKKVSAKKAKTAGSQSTLSGAAKPKARGGRVNRAEEHRLEYEKLIDQQDAAQALKYDMKAVFQTNQKVNHPKFGIGVIRSTQAERIEVVFQDEVRNLVHNRQ